MKKINSINLFRPAIMLLILATVILAGCQPTTSKTEFSTEQVCKDLVLFKTSYTQLQAMEGTASPNELNAQFSVVRQNFSNLVQSAANLQSVKKTSLAEAVDELTQAYDDLPEGAGVAEVMTSLDEELKAVEDALAEFGTELGCKLD